MPPLRGSRHASVFTTPWSGTVREPTAAEWPRSERAGRGLLWVIAAVVQDLVAPAVAQLAGRIPLSGSSYEWASPPANPEVSWGFGWLTFWPEAEPGAGVPCALRGGVARARTGRGR